MAFSFQDHFSKQASHYAEYRPDYPKSLFTYLASLTQSHERAWDCGTGNGQAAADLALHFDEVIATDPSAKQIEQAIRHPRIKYAAGAAGEKTPNQDASVDLVTVAQAAHWFDFDKFYAEVRRVLKPKGVIAIWCYERDWQISSRVNQILKNYSEEIVGPFWAPEVRYVTEHYQTLSFPFEELKAPQLFLEAKWNFEGIIGYLLSWSATQKYIEKNAQNPVEIIQADLLSAWGNPEEQKSMHWPIYMRLGRL